jgi:hypothetical protein
MDADGALALALARRLDAVTPNGVRVAAWSEEKIVVVGCSDGPPLVFVRLTDYDSAEAFAERLLDNVQEFTIENSVHGGWPPIDPSRPDDRQTASALPPASVVMEDETLHLWFGSRERPSLVLPPIANHELEELRREKGAADDGLAESLWSESLQLFRATRPMRERHMRERHHPA